SRRRHTSFSRDWSSDVCSSDLENPVGDRLSGGQYVIHREALIETPYLPDPAAGGVALRAAPGHEIPGVGAEMVLGPSCVVRRTQIGRASCRARRLQTLCGTCSS